MGLEQELRRRLTAAIKARNLKIANVIRMVNTKVMERRTAAGFSGQVDDALYLEVIAAYKKSLDKARVEFAGAGERGVKEIAELDFEIEFLRQFLPEQLPEDKVREAVKAAIDDLAAKDAKMEGRVVGAVMKKYKGLVDAAVVKRLVSEELR